MEFCPIGLCLEVIRVGPRCWGNAPGGVIRAHPRSQHEALSILVNRYQRLVWNVAAKIVPDSMEAEDVAQTVFVDLFQKMDLLIRTAGQ